MRFLLVTLILIISYIGDCYFGKPKGELKSIWIYIVFGGILYWTSFLFK